MDSVLSLGTLTGVNLLNTYGDMTMCQTPTLPDLSALLVGGAEGDPYSCKGKMPSSPSTYCWALG